MIRATHARSPDCPSKVIKHSCYLQSDAPGCQSGINEHIGPACIADNGKVAATYMEVANQENHLVSDVFEKIMSASLGHLIVAAEESNAVLRDRSNQKMIFLMLLPKAKISDNPQFLPSNKTILARKGTKAITDACHLGHSIHQDRGAHRHQSQRHRLLILARR